MKKILLAVGAQGIPEGVFDFIVALNQKNPILLTGVFLREITYAVSGRPTYFEGLGLPAFEHPMETFSPSEISEQVTRFEQKCIKNNIEFRVHDDTGDLILHELKKESRFADLLIVSHTFCQFDGLDVSSELQKLLHISECPVLITTDKMRFPEKVIVAYDGSENSAYAIKQFSYIFPELCQGNVLIAYASANEDETLPDQILVEEFAARHFPDLTFLTTKADRARLASFVGDETAAVLVTGSFSRSTLSEAARRSFAYDIIREQRLPVFIAHR